MDKNYNFTLQTEDYIAVAALLLCFNALFVFNFYVYYTLVSYDDVCDFRIIVRKLNAYTCVALVFFFYRLYRFYDRNKGCS